MSEENSSPCKNTDRELWREREGDYYADSLFVTEGGGIGMNVGGTVIVKPLKEWFELADTFRGWDSHSPMSRLGKL